VSLLSLGAGCLNAGRPPFDSQSTKRLSPEKRSQYDVIFFNEIVNWNVNTNRYVTDSQTKRKAELEQMAADGHLPSYVALRLLDFQGGTQRHDPEALSILLAEARKGDPSAMCALAAIPTRNDLWKDEKERIDTGREMLIAAARAGQGHCMGTYGGALVLGNSPWIPHDPGKGMPLALEAARQGYYSAAYRLFYVRLQKVHKGKFDFSNTAEVRRALCWGRLAQQHTNWSNFHSFLERLAKYTREHDRADLAELATAVDPRRVPITRQAVTANECIQMEEVTGAN
jgi:hypothetical protein